VKRTIFITGTDTGVGKTVLTALLLLHLRQNKIKALALKPFCSGDRRDVDILQSLQPGDLADEVMNPYFYSLPVSPLAAQKGTRRHLSLKEIRQRLREAGKSAECLLIEGAGGVMVPIAKDLLIVDLIADLGCEVFLVAKNQLGTINHTLLSVESLKKRGIARIKIILMDSAQPDVSSRTNKNVLSALLPGIEISQLPFLPKKPNKISHLLMAEKKYRKILARMVLDN
jgi:dethiobiotin synthetase